PPQRPFAAQVAGGLSAASSPKQRFTAAWGSTDGSLEAQASSLFGRARGAGREGIQTAKPPPRAQVTPSWVQGAVVPADAPRCGELTGDSIDGLPSADSCT